MDELSRFRSWSRLPFAAPAAVSFPEHPRDVRAEPGEESSIPSGAGRSYGDTHLNPGRRVLSTRRMNRVLDLDERRGIVTCEAGARLDEILARAVPRGWFLPTCPGTLQVTVGGAVAHDVHGKNQRSAGNFGRHVVRLELARTDGTRRACSPSENADLFAATVGGLGLTGLITRAELRLRKIHSTTLEVTTVRCASLEEVLERLQRTEDEYSFAWIDSFHRRPGARSLWLGARHVEEADGPLVAGAGRGGRLAALAPAALFNRGTMRLFNRLYATGGQLRRTRNRRSHYHPFLFPQDSVHPSNRVYGSRGVRAYHGLVPFGNERESVGALLERISRPGDQSLVTVLKAFGPLESPGLLSFSGPGISIACGFPNQGERTLRILADLDRIVARAGGRLYPAKDARMPPEMFRSSFPRWREFVGQVDPGMSSSFWRRVSAS